LTDDGVVIGWGYNVHGQCEIPNSLEGKFVVQIAAGSFHSLALTDDGVVIGWGAGVGGRCTDQKGPFLLPSPMIKFASKH